MSSRKTASKQPRFTEADEIIYLQMGEKAGVLYGKDFQDLKKAVALKHSSALLKKLAPDIKKLASDNRASEKAAKKSLAALLKNHTKEKARAIASALAKINTGLASQLKTALGELSSRARLDYDGISLVRLFDSGLAAVPATRSSSGLKAKKSDTIRIFSYGDETSATLLWGDDAVTLEFSTDKKGEFFLFGNNYTSSSKPVEGKVTFTGLYPGKYVVSYEMRLFHRIEVEKNL